MDIRFISSLTPEDENRFAPALLAAVSKLLDQFPLAYTVRVETAGGRVFQHSHAANLGTPNFRADDLITAFRTPEA